VSAAPPAPSLPPQPPPGAPTQPLLPLGAAGLAAVLELAWALSAGAGPRRGLGLALLVVGLGPLLSPLALLPGAVAALTAALRRRPARGLLGLLGLLLGLRVAEAASAGLFERLHRADLAGLILALAAAVPLGAGLAAGLAAGRWLEGRPRAAAPHPRWRTAAPWIALASIEAWGLWRATALGLWEHLPWAAPLGATSALGALPLLPVLRPGPRTERWRGAAKVALRLCFLAPPLAVGLLQAGGPPGTLPEQQGLLTRPLLPLLRQAWDRDGDGASPLLGGGDCDDRDPSVHPDAEDIPGDGVDQDCLGGDAAPDPALQDPLGLGGSPVRNPLALGRAPYRSLVLVVIDALRFAETGAAQPVEGSATPHLDVLAQQSAVFARTWSTAPATWPSVPSLLSGRYPQGLRWTRGGAPPALGAGNTMLAQRLHAAGLRSAAVVSPYLRYRLSSLGQGFDTFESVPGREASEAERADTSPGFLAKAEERVQEGGLPGLFLYLHFIDPHHPYRERAGFTRGTSDRARYRGELSYVDHHLGLLLDFLRSQEGWEDCAVIVTGDHGEEFGEHGGKFHATQLYEESIHVPLVIHAPGLPPGRYAVPTSLVDVAPTVLDLLGVEGAEGAGLQGRSLLPELLGRPSPAAAARRVFAGLAPWQAPRAATLGDDGLKLIQEGARLELFDLGADPGEQRNLGAERAAASARLRLRLQAWSAAARR